MKKTNNVIDKVNNDNMNRWMLSIVLLAAFVLLVIFCLYLYKFSSPLSPSLNSKPEVWGQFGDFIGGTANPILGFLTIISLVITINLQNKQLINSISHLKTANEELRLNREEMKKSVATLEAQVLVAEQVAKLNTVHTLLEIYKKEIHSLSNQSLSNEDPNHAKLAQLVDREIALKKMLEQYYIKLNS